MLFSSISFVFYFLPVTLIIYFLVPFKLKNPVLLIVSLFFYFWGEPGYSVLMVSSIGINFLIGRQISRSKNDTNRRRYLAASVLLCLSLLCFFKYADFLIDIVNSIFGTMISPLGIPLPLGISFYTFQIMSYTIDVYRADARVENNPFSFAAYVSFFPQLVAGPIVQYRTIAEELASRTHSTADFSKGAARFVVGLAKKVLLANRLGLLRDAALFPHDNSVLLSWLSVIAFALQVYFDFSGYSDMAIGMGRIFGFYFLENFDYPFISRSISEFWRRWHMSLGTWFREYLYIPLGGNRKGKIIWFRNLFIVWFCTGLWHGASWNFVIWGLFFGIVLCLEKMVPLGRFVPVLFKHLLTLLIVLLSFVIFHNDSMPDAIAQFKAMFGVASLPVSGSETVYIIRSYAVLLVISALGSTPIPKIAAIRLRHRFVKICAVLEPAVIMILLLVSTAYLASSSYNPFLYFRF